MLVLPVQMTDYIYSIPGIFVGNVTQPMEVLAASSGYVFTLA